MAKDDDFEITLPGASPQSFSQVYKPGTVVGGDYILLRSVGRGGMGEVFACEHKLIKGRRCALKILAPHMVTERTWLRFEREARALARLDHKGIVKIYTMGVDRETCPYYVMELIEGCTLAEHIGANGRLSIKEALDVFWQVATALDFAHRNAIVHRDLKPSNIMLLAGPDGQSVQVKLVDFGVVSLATDGESQRLTAIGEAVGTPLYMSPEQFMGEAITASADIYSLGCTLYEALTGRPPFKGENALQTIHMHQYKVAPRLSDSCAAVEFGPDLEYLVGRMLSKNPANRHQNMSQLIHDLERLRQGKKLVGAALQISDPVLEPEKVRTEFAIKRWQIAVLLVATFALIGTLSYWALARRVQYPTIAPVFSAERDTLQNKNQAPTKPAKTLFALGSDAMASDMTADEAKAFMALPPFNVPGVDKDGSRYFRFPTDMLIGTIDNGTRTVNAAGLIKIPRGYKPVLTMRQDFSLLPIAKLQPDSVHLDVSIGSSAHLKQFVELVSGWHSLMMVRICGMELTESDIAQLNKLPASSYMTFVSCRFGNQDFASCGALDHTHYLKLDGLPEVRESEGALPPGLKSLLLRAGKSHTIKQLAVFCAVWPGALTPVVCQQSNLNILCFDRVALTASDLVLFCHKPGLKELSIGSWPFAYEDVITALSGNPIVKNLILTDPLVEPKIKAAVAGVPRIKLGVTTVYTMRQIEEIKRRVPQFTLIPRQHFYLGGGQFMDFAHDY